MEKRYYVGLDVSLDKTAVCIVDDAGVMIREQEVLSDASSLCDFLSLCDLTYTSIGLEASDLSVWLYQSLEKAGYPVVCLETRHVKSALSAQNVKTDKNDARGLAQIMRTGWYKSVHVKSNEARKHRMLLGSRRLLVNKRVDIENQIRGVLKMFGLKMRSCKGRAYSERLETLIADHSDLQEYVRPLQRIRDALLDEIAGMDRQIYALTRYDTVCRRFMTIPGVGPIIALLYKSTIDDPHRFRRSRHVGVHLGLTPRKYASGQIDYDGAITKCGDPMLRNHLYEAAILLMRPCTKPNALKSWGNKLAKRSSKKNATVAVMRKLAVIMHRMWLDGTDFTFFESPAQPSYHA